MFTGIVEETGSIYRIQKGSNSLILTISASKTLEGLKPGDSVAVNGVCLTATSITKDTFTADVMHETVRRTSLEALGQGSKVNLERAMPADGRFAGHIVLGHIDGVGVVSSIVKDDNALVFTIRAEGHITRYIVEKGSVALDGVSLTVAKVLGNGFTVSVIPHTAKMTTLAVKRTGERVNIETDIIGKYVEKLTGGLAQNKRLTKEQLAGF